MALDSFVIGGLAEELHRRLENARVDKVTMPRRDRIILHLRTLKEGNVRLLLCAGNGARVHLTKEKFDNPETPPMLCMLLRKQMAGGRILSVTQPEHERRVDIRFSAVDELGVKAIDTKTIELTLVQPCAWFLEIMAFPTYYPVRKDIIEANGDAWTTSPETLIGNGPYKLESYTMTISSSMV